jgi:hypothetical protein
MQELNNEKPFAILFLFLKIPEIPDIQLFILTLNFARPL